MSTAAMQGPVELPMMLVLAVTLMTVIIISTVVSSLPVEELGAASCPSVQPCYGCLAETPAPAWRPQTASEPH